MSACSFPGCGLRTRLGYPGNDPENGPARFYCPAGHATCYGCGKAFLAIEHIEASIEHYEDGTPIELPATTVEHDACDACTAECVDPDPYE